MGMGRKTRPKVTEDANGRHLVSVGAHARARIRGPGIESVPTSHSSAPATHIVCLVQVGEMR